MAPSFNVETNSLLTGLVFLCERVQHTIYSYHIAFTCRHAVHRRMGKFQTEQREKNPEALSENSKYPIPGYLALFTWHTDGALWPNRGDLMLAY